MATLASSSPAGFFQLLGGQTDRHPQGESGLGGVRDDAGEFGQLVDEFLDALLALPVEERERGPERDPSRDRAEEGGEYRAGEEPEAGNGGDHVDEELTRGEIETGGGETLLDLLAEAGLFESAVDAPEAPSPPGSGDLLRR